MKKKALFFSFLLFILCSFNLLAENFPQKASKVEDFIPKGWKKLIVEKGDLNKDKIEKLWGESEMRKKAYENSSLYNDLKNIAKELERL